MKFVFNIVFEFDLYEYLDKVYYFVYLLCGNVNVALKMLPFCLNCTDRTLYAVTFRFSVMVRQKNIFKFRFLVRL